MRRIITLVFSCVFFISYCSVQAQCTIDHSLTTPGFSPSSLPCIIQGQTYGQAVQFLVPSTVTVNSETVSVDSISIVSIAGLPTGISYALNPGNSPVAADSNGCIWISGSVNDTTGAFPLTINASIWIDGQPQPIDTSLNAAGFNYAVSVCAQSFDACDSVTNFSPEDVPSFYEIPANSFGALGYVAGNNSYAYPIELAEELTPPAGATVTAVNFVFAYATLNSSDSDVALNIYLMDNTGPNYSPGNVLDSTAITLRDVAHAVSTYHSSGQLVEVSVPFNIPVAVDGSPVFAVIDLPQNVGDTLAMVTTNTSSPDGEAWENIGYTITSQGGAFWDKFADDYDVAGFGLFASINVCTNKTVAAFSASPTSLCANNSVYFTDQSTSARTAWSWTFNGGNPPNSILQNPIITYNSSGTYPVSLTVYNLAGQDSITKLSYITVLPVPADSIISFTPPASATAANGAIQVTGTGGAVPYAYYWSTGDSTATVTDLAVGTYQLTITDNNVTY
jgi:hypothetical protein